MSTLLTVVPAGRQPGLPDRGLPARETVGDAATPARAGRRRRAIALYKPAKAHFGPLHTPDHRQRTLVRSTRPITGQRIWSAPHARSPQSALWLVILAAAPVR